MTTEIQTVERNEKAHTQASPLALIDKAVESGASIETLERLMDLQERWQAGEAKRAYNVATSKFQLECPRIVKTKQGHNYKYAPLGDIVEQIKGTLNKCGLSFRFEQSQDANGITVTCVVTHIAGHSERTSLTVSPDTSGSKNSVQAVGSAVTYGQRYTLIGALGITTADEDIDGRLPDEFKAKPNYVNFKNDRPKIEASIKSGRPADDIIEQLEKDYKLSDAVRGAILNMAKEQSND